MLDDNQLQQNSLNTKEDDQLAEDEFLLSEPVEKNQAEQKNNQAELGQFNQTTKQVNKVIEPETTEEAFNEQMSQSLATDNLRQEPLKEAERQNDISLENDLTIKDKPQVTSQENEIALDEKIKQIELERLEQETAARATQQGLEYINLSGLPILPEALAVINENDAREKQIICFMFIPNKEMRLAVVNYNQATRDFIEKLRLDYQETPIHVFLTSKHSFEKAVKMYAALPKIIDNPDEVKILEADLQKKIKNITDLKNLQKEIQQTSTTELFSLILAAATKLKASDIHIEAEQTAIKLRFRIDGVLHQIAELDKTAWQRLLSRLKLNAKLKINVTDKPQDGNFSINLGGEPIDFRVSSLPTTYGESIVIRILYHNKVKQMQLDNLGIAGYNRKLIEKEIQKPNGMLVVTGPTGSGKTTTLYAILNKLNTDDNKIITVEDPVEYKIPGINQSEIKKDKGYTFAKALRSIVRQDPDIILVGEIRDNETAEIALNAALTGHLVFTTLHTNSATGVIPRFLSLGAKPYLLAPAINVSIAQRLVRRVCPHCRQEISLNEEQRELVQREIESLPENSYQDKLDLGKLKLYEGQGCQECAGLGYKGQIGIFELFVITDKVRELILNGEISETQLNEIARRNGMLTMRQDGILKALQGITSLAEVLRVT